MVAQRISDAVLRKELSGVWPSLSQRTMDLLVTPHTGEHVALMSQRLWKVTDMHNKDERHVNE